MKRGERTDGLPRSGGNGWDGSGTAFEQEQKPSTFSAMRSTSSVEHEPSLQSLPLPLVGLILFGVLCFGLPCFSSSDDDGYGNTSGPSRITRVESAFSLPSPALRGCCGEPFQFQWIFPDGTTGPAGSPVRTKMIALDAQGRQARPSACTPLRINLDLTGKAQLSLQTKPLEWRNAELPMTIENDMAETIQAELRIQSPDPTADVLLHSSVIRFTGHNKRAFSAAATTTTTTIKVARPGPRKVLGYGNASTDPAWKPKADEVREAFLHAWEGYKKYAWGRDELKPVSKSGKDTYGGIGMTIIDALSTLHLMGLKTEFAKAADFLEEGLDFDKVVDDVSVFELNIRALGGLLGAHALSKRRIFLDRAEDIADRLLPALNTTSKFPLPRWNVARMRGPPSTEPTILAEAGSLQLELRQLSRETREKRYKEAGDASFDAIQAGGIKGLLPVFLTPPERIPPRPIAAKIQMGALADSYYEYLLKQWLQTPEDTRMKDLWLDAMDEMPTMLVKPRDLHLKTRDGGIPKYKLAVVEANGDVEWKMDHLSCFAPGMIALGLRSLPDEDLRHGNRNETWWRLAEGLTESCVQMWTSSKTGLAPEFVKLKPHNPHDFGAVPSDGRHSFLRPETAESLFYMFRFTGDEKYRRYGYQMFQAIVKHSKAEAGFATVQDVNQIPTKLVDEMQSFVFAETFKYLYLLFAPASTLDLDKYVLNTEAHPFRRPDFPPS